MLKYGYSSKLRLLDTSGEASHQCLVSEAAGIKVEPLLKAEKLQSEADGLTDDWPAGPQVEDESEKTDRRVGLLKGGSRSAPNGGQSLQGLWRL